MNSGGEASSSQDDWSEDEAHGEAHDEAHGHGTKASTPDPIDGDQVTGDQRETRPGRSTFMRCMIQ